MEQYISKSALVAEINKRIIDAPINNIGHQRVWAYNDVKDILDTLEEVDLEKKEIIDKACWWLNNNRLGVIDDDYIKEFRKAINN